MREFINGAKAIARGAIHAGCNFFAGYPITPASDILQHMIEELPKVGGTAIQGEDEIASIGFCIGAAMAGAKVMTATSGPGISLYSENIGLAIMGEVPMVIVDCQRMGPATGGATTGAQGDIQFLRWGTSGGYPLIVLSPTNVPECYSLTRRAFDLAERFRVPVILATNKETVLTSTTVDIDSYEEVPVRERPILPEGEEFRLYEYEDDKLSDVVPMAPFGSRHIVRFTTSSHDKWGYLCKNPDVVRRLNRHLASKIEDHADEIAMVKADMQEGAETLIISYGITARSVAEAVEMARQKGIRVSALTVYSLWPVPERKIRDAMAGVRQVVVAELNLGQYRREIKRLAGAEQDVIGVNLVSGELLDPEEILKRGGIR